MSSTEISDPAIQGRVNAPYTPPMATGTCPKRPFRLYIREWIDYKELDQKHVAELMECGEGTLSRLISGKMRRTDEWLARIAHALNVEVVDLFRDPRKPTQEDLLRDLPQSKRDEIVRVIKALTAQ